MDENPFPDLFTHDVSIMDMAKQRVTCPDCGRKRMYFCYSCRMYVNNLQTVMPKVELPVQVHIIKHTKELDSKSTAVHAALLAPTHCHIYSYPDIPEYNSTSDVVVYPSEDSMTVADWAKSWSSNSTAVNTCEHKQQPAVRTIIFIDCTWTQTHSIISSPQLSGLVRISMCDYHTQFWRPNGAKRGATYLSTIEAIYFFLREYHTTYLNLPYDAEYDNLLMIFKFMFLKIKKFHNGGDNLKAYRHK
ncbi:DTWD1 [Bugula neritina]|uniref:tRNA-uridine aminocarboxypropyltransferase 1 n=1 Tax=Bugula neritina TaxID=10212 RepID=A0A7J7K467_BUGNE|nr:DTWD1 [Bugula neritina]